MKKQRLTFLISTVAILLGLTLTCVWSFAGLAEMPFHPDESNFIYVARYFDLFFLKRNFANPEWGTTNYWARFHPPLSKYLIGFALFITGHDFSALNQPWDWTLDKETNFRLGNVPSASALMASRSLMTTLFALSIVLCAAVAYRVGGWPAAFAAGLVLATNDLALRTLRRATPDSPLLFFSLVTVLSSMKLIDHLSSSTSNAPRRTYIWGALTGLGLGLAAASKLSAASLLPMVLLSPGVPLCIHTFRGTSFPSERTLVRLFIVVFVVAIVVFILPNPMLWRNPLQSTQALVSHRLWEADQQQSGFPEGALTTAPARVRAAVNHIFEPVSLVAFILGSSLLVWQEFEGWRTQEATGRTALLLRVAGTLGFTVVFTPMNWGRYFTPLIPCKAVILGYLAFAAITTLRKVLPYKL